jgi:hypothetical protein
LEQPSAVFAPIAEIIADGTNKELCLKWFKVNITPIQTAK